MPETVLCRLSFDPMAAVWTSVIAVLGTLCGVGATYVFQGRLARNTESAARDERLRQERLVACSGFAGAVMDLRGVQYSRTYSRLNDASGRTDRSAIRAESSQLRSVAWTAFYRFRLTAPSEHLERLALQALQASLDLTDASDKAELRRRSEQARAGIDEFITAAADYVRSIALESQVRPELRARSRSLGSDAVIGQRL
jgi:hypothetical protein